MAKKGTIVQPMQQQQFVPLETRLSDWATKTEDELNSLLDVNPRLRGRIKVLADILDELTLENMKTEEFSAQIARSDLTGVIGTVRGALEVVRWVLHNGLEALRELAPDAAPRIIQAIYGVADFFSVALVVIETDTKTATEKTPKSFTSRYTLDDGSYRWLVNGEAIANGTTLLHTFDKVGQSYVRLEVTKNEQTVSDQVQIEVKAAVQPSPDPGTNPNPTPNPGVKKNMIVMFEELRLREEARWGANRERIQILLRRKRQDGEYLHPTLQKELRQLLALFPQVPEDADARIAFDLNPHLAPHPDEGSEAERLIMMQDPLFVNIVETMRGTNRDGFEPQWHLVGLFESQVGPASEGNGSTPLRGDEKAIAAIYGILMRERVTDPALGRRFHNALAQARAEYERHSELFHRVLNVLIAEGRFTISSITQDGGEIEAGMIALPDTMWVPLPAFRLLADNRDALRKVNVEQWASVARVLVQDGVTINTGNLDLRIRQVLQGLSGHDENATPSAMDIDLPDLEQQSDLEIVIENVVAMQAIFFAATLEELRLFQVRDKLLELFQQGMLPIVRGRAGDILYRQMRKSVSRLSEYDRRNLYGRTLGQTGGDANNATNRDFQILWMRFVSAVSSFARQTRVDSLLRAEIPARVHQEQVRKSGRDLAANLSLYGYGMAYFAATELQTEINEIIELLSDSEVRGAYGARDMWGVIDQVAALELGGARDSIRYRTMASAGAVIIAWLAKHAAQLQSIGIGDVLDVKEIAQPNIRPQGQKITRDPYDSDLVNACEQWLITTGTQEAQVIEYSEPSIGPSTTSRPIQIPSIARDMLESVGFRANGY